MTIVNRKLLRTVMLGLLLAAWGGPAAAASCPDGARPSVSFQGRFIEPRYDRTLDRDGISRLSRSQGLAGHVFAGLTHGSYETRVSVNVRVMPRGRGACVQPVSVQGSAAYRDLTVYLAREYPPGSCQYRAILDHERQHVAINKRIFEAYIPRLRRGLRRAADRLGGFWVADVDQAGQIAAQRLQDAIKPTLNDMERETRAANAKIDTPESYRAISARCSSW